MSIMEDQILNKINDESDHNSLEFFSPNGSISKPPPSSYEYKTEKGPYRIIFEAL